MDAYVTGKTIKRSAKRKNSLRVELLKLYPEGDASCRFTAGGRGNIYAFCNRHGLMKEKV